MAVQQTNARHQAEPVDGMETRRMNLHKLLDKYDKCPLECDGLTRVLHTVLTRNGYSHTVKLGCITLGSNASAPHFWIELPDGRFVDYRARMWVGYQASHGIFRQSQVSYEGEPIYMEPLDERLFKILTGGIT